MLPNATPLLVALNSQLEAKKWPRFFPCSQISSQKHFTSYRLFFIDRIERQINTIQNRIIENMKSWKNSDKLVGLIKMRNNSENWS